MPVDGDQLMAELARHGVRPGQRVQLSAVVTDVDDCSTDETLPDYFGSFASGQPDLAERSSEILQAGFPGE